MLIVSRPAKKCVNFICQNKQWYQIYYHDAQERQTQYWPKGLWYT